MHANNELINVLTRWSSPPAKRGDGVIVGCTANFEWLLPWWWLHYQMQNIEYPVTFFDFGDMSTSAKKWCEKRGQLKSLPNVDIEKLILKKEDISTHRGKIWESPVVRDVWKARSAWFKKPFACLQTPYERTVWLDLDCQVRRSITPLFHFCDTPHKVSMVREPEAINTKHKEAGELLEGEIEYNSGVIAFKHGAELISDWFKMCMESNAIVRGDQEAFSRMLHEKGIIITPFPEHFSQRSCYAHATEDVYPKNPAVIILHWCGAQKHYVNVQMELLKQKTLMNFSLGST